MIMHRKWLNVLVAIFLISNKSMVMSINSGNTVQWSSNCSDGEGHPNWYQAYFVHYHLKINKLFQKTSMFYLKIINLLDNLCEHLEAEYLRNSKIALIFSRPRGSWVNDQYNTLHILYSNSRTTEPGKSLMIFFTFFRNLLPDIITFF